MKVAEGVSMHALYVLSQLIDWPSLVLPAGEDYLSALQGLRKPDPKSFKVVSDTLGVPPEQLLLIDDRQANIVGALESGWGALQFNNAPALRRDLERKRILDGKLRINPG